MVAKGNDGFLLLPEEVVVRASVEWCSWSADGEFLLVARREPFSLEDMMNLQLKGGRPDQILDQKGSICIWSRKKHVMTELVGTGSAPRGQVEGVFLPNSSVALLSVSSTTARAVNEANELVENASIIWVDCSAKKTKVLAQASSVGRTLSFSIVADPNGQYFAVLGVKDIPNETADGQPASNTRSTTIDIVDRTGKIVKSTRVADNLLLLNLAWDKANGLRAGIYSNTPGEASGLRNSLFFSVPSLETRTAPTPKYMPEPTSASAANLELLEGVHKVTQGKAEKQVQGVWLFGDKGEGNQPVLVCTDARQGQLSPTNNGVTYIRDSGVFVRTIVKVDKRIIDDAKKAAEKTVLMSNAKQVALGLILYAADNGDVLPGPSGWESLVSQYLKNDSLMSGFVYTFGGGDMNKIEKPAETVLGYIVGPGGRAVAYVDGHVKWENDK
jgi:prepilin-type processing-associated H-X9-DG protein